MMLLLMLMTILMLMFMFVLTLMLFLVLMFMSYLIIALSRDGLQILFLESPCDLSWKKDRMEGRFIKLCIAKTKPPIFIFMYFTKEVKKA